MEENNRPANPFPQPTRGSAAPPGAGTNGFAIASLILGILGIFTCVMGLPALILGIVAMVQLGKNPQDRGSGYAIAGIALGAISILMVPIMAAILFPVFAKAREQARKTVCLSNVKSISLQMMMYSQDYDGKFPPPERWNQVSNNPKVLKCPSAGSLEPSYALNAGLRGVSIKDVKSPAQTVAIFDSLPGANRSGGPELLPNPPRHMSGNVIGYADGHARWVSETQQAELVWDPAKMVIRGGPGYQ